MGKSRRCKKSVAFFWLKPHVCVCLRVCLCVCVCVSVCACVCVYIALLLTRQLLRGRTSYFTTATFYLLLLRRHHHRFVLFHQCLQIFSLRDINAYVLQKLLPTCCA